MTSRSAVVALAAALVATWPAVAVAAARTIESRIDGEFHGWSGRTVFRLANGQIWRQISPGYVSHYAFRPRVLIAGTDRGYAMTVAGVRRPVSVEQIYGDAAGIAAGYADGTGAGLAFSMGGAPAPVPGMYGEVRLVLGSVSAGAFVLTDFDDFAGGPFVRSDLGRAGGLVWFGQAGPFIGESPGVFGALGADYALSANVQVGLFGGVAVSTRTAFPIAGARAILALF